MRTPRENNAWLRRYSYGILRYPLRYRPDAWKAYFEGRGGCLKWESRPVAHDVRARTEPLGR